MSEKEKNKTPFKVKAKLLTEFMGKYKSAYVAAILAVAVATLIGYVVPLIVRYTIDNVVGGYVDRHQRKFSSNTMSWLIRPTPTARVLPSGDMAMPPMMVPAPAKSVNCFGSPPSTG